jgi:hypothetical protein
MGMNPSYLVNAGWLFFAAWSLVVLALSVTAFGRDLFPAQKHTPRDLKTAKPSTAHTAPHW